MIVTGRWAALARIISRWGRLLPLCAALLAGLAGPLTAAPGAPPTPASGPAAPVSEGSTEKAIADSATVAAPPPPAWLKQFAPTHDKRMKWWREARFGMFIHWGVYAVPAGVWNGQEVKRSGAEWIMNRGRIPVADYQKLPARFEPVKFDATAWVDVAKRAGMKYIVITAKHHDGFAMYHSKADKFNVFDATPWKRDPLKELAAAAKKAGIKLGFYYSQAQDWNHPGGAAAGGHWDAKAQDGSMDDYLERVAVPQIKELLTGYGNVAVLWWDTPVDMTPERGDRLLPLLALQPGIVSNNRLYRTKTGGDFETPEQKIPSSGIPGKDWETCMTINGTWGFRASDHNWKSTETLLRNLVDIASKGGNFLLNVGPTAEGEIPEESIERLRQMGAWLAVNGQSIYGTTATPFAEPLPWGRATTRKTGARTETIYLHVFDWPKDGKLLVPALAGKITGATLLAGAKKLAVSAAGAGTTVSLPPEAPDPISSTIALRVSDVPTK
jgi:alpha-L-fucosidase